MERLTALAEYPFLSITSQFGEVKEHLNFAPRLWLRWRSVQFKLFLVVLWWFFGSGAVLGILRYLSLSLAVGK